MPRSLINDNFFFSSEKSHIKKNVLSNILLIFSWIVFKIIYCALVVNQAFFVYNAVSVIS